MCNGGDGGPGYKEILMMAGSGGVSSVDDLRVERKSGYTSLRYVLDAAYDQASRGKGNERHATDNAFEDQLICQIQRILKGHPLAGQAFQVIKKTVEAGRLAHIKGPDAAESELLGAINYLSAMVILIREGFTEKVHNYSNFLREQGKDEE